MTSNYPLCVATWTIGKPSETFIPDAVVPEETGLLVAEGDGAAMAAAIVRLARDASLLARLGAEGRPRVEERFTFQIERSRLLRLVGLDPEVSGGSH